MATKRLPIIEWASEPDTSGKAWFESYSILSTNRRGTILRIDEDGTNATALTTEEGIAGRFDVPQDYVDTANVVIIWSSTITTNDVKFDFDYLAVGGNDTESLDQASFTESVTAEDTAPSAAHERMERSIALTDGNFAVGDTVLFEFTAGPAAGTDLAGATLIFGLFFEYADA